MRATDFRTPAAAWTGAFALALLGWMAPARAQQQAQGFAVERLYQSAPGAGWFVMDSLDMHGGLGGTAALTLGYSKDPLVITSGSQHVTAVSNDAFADFGFAATYDRWRFYLNLDSPLLIDGQNGSLDGYTYAAPSVNLASHPDTLSDTRIGADVRIIGGPASPFRFGASAQLIAPSGTRADYDTDGTFRGMIRALIAGDSGLFTYAAQLGVHIRPLDEPATPGAPLGSELLFGVAAGAKLPVGSARNLAVVVGPELYGASPFTAFFHGPDTPFEALLSGRIEGTQPNALQLRGKVGIGVGLNPRFGAPEWRIVAGIEMFDHRDEAGNAR